MVLFVLAWLSIHGTARAADTLRLSAPVVQDNLAVYLIHGPSRAGPVPLTLAEALESGDAVLRETGTIAELSIENIGERPVFVQVGDIVKGGLQDRVIAVSVIVPPGSGPIAVSALCVEEGRWGTRDGEDSTVFASAEHALPFRVAMVALLGAAEQMEEGRQASFAPGAQALVWNVIASMQRSLPERLAGFLGGSSPASSLNAMLEDPAIEIAAGRYMDALGEVGTGDETVIGVAFAIGGEIRGADLYPSNAMFRKLWPRLLRTAASEAATERATAPGAAAPSGEDVLAFLANAQSGETAARKAGAFGAQETRQTAAAVYFEAVSLGGGWTHRSYVAR